MHVSSTSGSQSIFRSELLSLCKITMLWYSALDPIVMKLWKSRLPSNKKDQFDDYLMSCCHIRTNKSAIN